MHKPECGELIATTPDTGADRHSASNMGEVESGSESSNHALSGVNRQVATNSDHLAERNAAAQ
jgi:hypothetical protein